MRTFVYSDATSHKFWNIELRGKEFTVTFGRVGTAGQSQVKSFPDEERARKEHDKLIKEKTGKGYTETTPAVAEAKPATMREALERALVESPDDLASHMAYADYLTDQGDPLGEFIRVQLTLEDDKLPAAERKKFQAREKKLLKEHGDAWLGDLAPHLLEPRVDKAHPWNSTKVKFAFCRGWLAELTIDRLTVAFARALAQAPQLRLLRTLTITDAAYEEHWEEGPDIPEGADDPALYPLCRARYLGNVRKLFLGEEVDEEEAAAEGAYFNARTDGAAAVGLVKLMPRIEELHLLAHDVDTRQLFALSMPHLRVLRVYHLKDYPLEKLAKNASLTKLEHLAFHPHGIEDDEAYIRLPGVKAIVRSPHLTSLKHLQLRLSDMGDKGVKEVIDSGILKRLKVLDLRHGCITDKGAKLLAACPDLNRLERLDLVSNNLSTEGEEALKAMGVKVDLRRQWDDPDELEFGSYLGEGDIE